MSLRNQSLVDAQVSVNRAVFTSNLSPKELEKLIALGLHSSEKDALGYMRYQAEQAIKDLNKFLEETK